MRKTSKSSDRQKEIFQFIKAFLLEKGYPPSVREIGEAVGLKSSSTVHSYLSRLEANGMIKREAARYRYPRRAPVAPECAGADAHRHPQGCGTL